MSPSELKMLIKARHKAGIFRPLFLEAAPGVGKTEIVGQVTKELKIGFKTIHGPLMQPEDCGIPVVSKDRTDVTFVVPSEKFPIEGSDCPEEGILLIDDMPQAGPDQQKTFGNLVQEREVHGKRLKKGWTIVLTGNRMKDRAGANKILGHLGNKLTRIPLEVSLDDWTQWALQNAVAPEIISFIRFRPGLLSDYDPNREINPTPRAWVHGVNAMFGLIDQSLEHAVFSGDVGEGPAAEFLGFLRIYRKLPNPDTILMNPTKAEVPTDPATLYATCGALAHRADSKNFGRAVTYARRMPPEFTMLFMKSSTDRDSELAHCKEFIDWASSRNKK